MINAWNYNYCDDHDWPLGGTVSIHTCLTVESFYRFDCLSGTKGRNKGEFTNLQGVAASQGKVLIADSNNQCVQVITTLQLWSHKVCVHTVYVIPYWFGTTGILKRWPVSDAFWHPGQDSRSDAEADGCGRPS